ncbi:mCG1028283, partial [Mus musculus]
VSAFFFMAAHPVQNHSLSELTGSSPVSWTGIPHSISCSCSVLNPASAFPFVAGVGTYNGPERLQPQNQGDLPAAGRGALPLVKGSEEPCQF